MKVDFFDLNRLYLEQKKEIDAAVIQALESGHYILGKRGEAFEKLMTESLQNTSLHVLGCNSGTDALILSLLAAEVKPGDEVITVSVTAIPTITAIQSIGAIPVMIDIDPETWVMDVEKVVDAMNARTKAIVPVHLYGNLVDIPKLLLKLENMRRKDVAVVEDCAQAQGAMFLSPRAHAGTLGRFGAFSFYPSKNIGAIGDAGAVIASGHDVEKIRMLRNYGQKNRYYAEMPRGINSRLDEVQAAILSVRFSKLNEWNEKKHKQVQRYHSELSALPIRFQKKTINTEPAWHLCVIELESEAKRDEFVLHLAKKQIQTLIHYPTPNHLQPAFVSARKFDLKSSEQFAKKIVSLPMNAGLREDEQSYVIESIKSFF